MYMLENSVSDDQLPSEEASCSGFTLLQKGFIQVQQNKGKSVAENILHWSICRQECCVMVYGFIRKTLIDL